MEMKFLFIHVLFAMCFVWTECFGFNHPVEIDLVNSQLQLLEDVIISFGAIIEDVDHFRERTASSKRATSAEVSKNITVEQKLDAFKQTMNDLVYKNNIFLKNLFTAVFPDGVGTDEGAEQEITLRSNLLAHCLEIKRLFSYHISNEGMELWKLLGLTLDNSKKFLTQEMGTT